MVYISPIMITALCILFGARGLYFLFIEKRSKNWRWELFGITIFIFALFYELYRFSNSISGIVLLMEEDLISAKDRAVRSEFFRYLRTISRAPWLIAIILMGYYIYVVEKFLYIARNAHTKKNL